MLNTANKLISIFNIFIFSISLSISIQTTSSATEETDWLESLQNTDKEPETKDASKKSSEITALDLNPSKTISTKENTSSQFATENQYGTLNEKNPISLRSHAEQHLKVGHIKTSLRLIEKSLELAPDNKESRFIYALALEAKLDKENPKTASTYNACVKQWFYLFKKSDFEEDSSGAAKHLKNLTGVTPHYWNKAEKYLAKVLKPEENSKEEPPQIN